MKYLIPLIFAFNFTYGQNSEMKNLLLDKSLKKDSIIIDFDHLYNLTKTIHPGLYFFTTEQEFDKCYDSLRNTITSDISILEFYQKTATLMAKIKDGHTSVNNKQMNLFLKQKLVFPFSIYKTNNDFYFHKTAMKDKSLVGCKIVKINGNDIQKIVTDLQKYFVNEGENKSAINQQLKTFPFFYYIYDQSENFIVEYLDSSKIIQTINFKGLEYEKFQKSISERKEFIEEEFSNNGNAILKINSFANGYDETQRKISEKQLDVFFRKLDSLKTKHLILDLRDNGGGAIEIASYLLSYLINKPFYYLEYYGTKFKSIKDWVHFAQYPDQIEEINLTKTILKNGLYCVTDDDWGYLKQQQNKITYYKGELSVLINGGCGSTTGHFLALLREYSIGKFYGEYSFQSNYSNSGIQNFILPYSKTLYSIPFYYFKINTHKFIYDPKGIKPDFEILLEPNDLKTNFDRQLNFVKNQFPQF
jgi:C-terminal processing protease CtpA/Prc